MRADLRIGAFVALVGLAASWRAQFSWATPVDGFWQDQTKWQPEFVPLSGAVTLGYTTAYTVTLTGNIGLGSLTISNPQATLGIINNSFLSVGSIPAPMNGTIIVSPTGGANGTYLEIVSFHDATLPGPGSVVLNATGNGLDRAFLRITGGGRGINQATIRGTGNIYGQWINNGTMQADANGGVLQFANSFTHTNNNLIKATNGGIFSLSGFTLDQSAGGRLVANGGVVSLNSTTVVGGTVESLGGIVSINGNVTWNGVHPIGPQAVPNNSGLYIVSPGLIHDDVLTINPSGGGNGTLLQFTAGGTFGGTGTTILNATGNGLDRAYIQAVNLPVTHGANRLLRGSGNIYGQWVNDGIIRADATGGILQFATNTFHVNNNRIEAVNGGILSFNNGVVDQTSGGQLVADAATLSLNSTVVVGGLMESQNGGNLALSSAYIIGADVRALSGGTVSLFGANTWNSVTSVGPVDITNNSGLYVTSSELLNDSIITVNPSGGGNGTFLQFTAGGTFGGAGTLILNATGNGLDRAYVQAVNLPLTHGANRLLRGSGNIYGQWINEGVIQADVSGGILQFATNAAHINNKLIRALNGGILTINSSSFDQGPNGRLVADAGSLVLNSSSIIGGTVESLNGGEVVLTGGVTWNSVQPVGPVNVPNNCTLSILSEGLSHDGVITVNPSGGGNGTQLQFNSGGVFGGAGTTVLNATGNGLDRAYLNAVNQPMTHGAGRTLRGSGNIYGQWINNGIFKADIPGLIMQLATNTSYTNNNLIEAVNGGFFTINSASLNQTGGGRLVADGGTVNLNNSYIAGGTVESLNGGAIAINGTVSFGGVHPIGPLSIPNNCTLSIVAPGLSHDGLLTINPSGGGNGTLLLINAGGVLGGAGTTLLNATAGSLDRAYIRVSGPPATLGNAHTIKGTGNLYGFWNIAGTLAPSAATDGAPATGTLRFDASPVLLPTFTFKIGVAGPGKNDKVVINGPAQLHGVLIASLIGGFNPPQGSTYDVLLASTVVGVFDTSGVPAKFTVSYLPDRVRLTATCSSDLNNDGVVDDADFVIFVAAYNILDCADPTMPPLCPSDINGDGVVDDADFSIFVAAYDALLCP